MFVQHQQMKDAAPWSPMAIVDNEAFTAREKLELLLQLRGEATGEAHFLEHSYTETDAEAAIDALRSGLEGGGTDEQH